MYNRRMFVEVIVAISIVFFSAISSEVVSTTLAQAPAKSQNAPGLKSSEPTSSLPAPKIDPKPRIIELMGGQVMFQGVDASGTGFWRDAEGADSWRTPGVIHAVQGRYRRDQVISLKAEPVSDSRPSMPAGFQLINSYITRDGKVLDVGMIYREDGSVEVPLVLTCGDKDLENRTSVLPVLAGKSALLVKNNSGSCPIFAGVFDDRDITLSRASSKQPGSQSRPVGVTNAKMVSEGYLSFAPVYRDDGSYDPAHAWKGGGGKIENRTQVVDLYGGKSAFLLADPKSADPLLKGIYPSKQIHSSSEGILLTEQYLTLEAEILSLDTLYGPEKPAKFVGGRLGDTPIENRTQVIKLAGNRSAVFTADPHSTSGVPKFLGIQKTKVSQSAR
jgi:hypothetical protein